MAGRVGSGSLRDGLHQRLRHDDQSVRTADMRLGHRWRRFTCTNDNMITGECDSLGNYGKTHKQASEWGDAKIKEKSKLTAPSF